MTGIFRRPAAIPSDDAPGLVRPDAVLVGTSSGRSLAVRSPMSPTARY